MSKRVPANAATMFNLPFLGGFVSIKQCSVTISEQALSGFIRFGHEMSGKVTLRPPVQTNEQTKGARE